jgi:predicted ATPase
LENNPIYRVGLQLAAQYSVLCLDEFQVTDIADAVVLSQLFGVLFRKGTVVVATSNRPPQELYEGGLNRSYFLPFIDLLQKHCIVHSLQSQIDYRKLLASSSNSSFFLLAQDNDTEQTKRELLQQLLHPDDNDDDDDDEGTMINRSSDTPSTTTMELDVGFQRTLTVKRVYGSSSSSNTGKTACCFSFEELCDADLGANDYRAIARQFDIVILEDIPTLNLEGHNRARRFITLIDELYEGKCALLCCALEATTPMELFESTTTSTTTISKTRSTTTAATTSLVVGNDGDDVVETTFKGIDVATQGGTAVGALASVRELAFAFERASSRLFEMCSRSWWDRVLEERRRG